MRASEFAPISACWEPQQRSGFPSWFEDDQLLRAGSVVVSSLPASHTTGSNTVEYKSGEIFGEIKNKVETVTTLAACGASSKIAGSADGSTTNGQRTYDFHGGASIPKARNLRQSRIRIDQVVASSGDST
jgi:hypothetical protein